MENMLDFRNIQNSLVFVRFAGDDGKDLIVNAGMIVEINFKGDKFILSVLGENDIELNKETNKEVLEELKKRIKFLRFSKTAEPRCGIWKNLNYVSSVVPGKIKIFGGGPAILDSESTWEYIKKYMEDNSILLSV